MPLRPKKLRALTKIIYILALLTCCFTGFAQDHGPGQVIEKIVAKVDDEIILKSELEMAHIEFKKSQQFTVEDLKCKVLETLIINKLLLAKATIDSVTISREEVDQQLERRMAQILQAYGADESTIEEKFGKTVQDLQNELRKDLRDQLLLQKMQGKITDGVTVTPSEVKKFFNEIPRDSLPFFSTEMEVAHIVKMPTAGKDQKQQTIDKLNNLRKRILAGEDFGKLALENSEDYVSAADSGRLGYFNKSDLVGEYVSAAVRLGPGEISPVIESQFGFHIIELLDVRGNQISTRHILLSAKANVLDEGRAKSFLDSLRREIILDSISFSQAANKFSDDVMTKTSGGFFTDESGSNRVPANRTDIIGPDLFFLTNRLKHGDVSNVEPYKSPDGKNGFRIVYLRKKIKAHEANLTDDYQKIYNATLAEKKNKAINKWFEETKKEVYIDVDKEFSHCEILVNQ